MVLSVPNFFRVKAEVILRARMFQSVMIRVISLDQDLARAITTSSPASHLREELEGSFGGPEIW